MGTELNGAPVITAVNLRKMYGPHLALDDVNLEIPSGAVGILGPNGAGKSTLFKCLLGLIKTTSGEGTVLGYDIRTEGDKIRSRIGYMPEYDALDPGLAAIDQVRYSGELLGMNPAHATQRAHEVLEYVGLKDQRYRKIETFSTGMMQATKLACALVHDPEILICDEPIEDVGSDHPGIPRVWLLDDAISFVGRGRNVMQGYVLGADPHLTPGQPCLVVDGNGGLVAHGTAVTTALEMAHLKKGIAVRVRDGALRDS